jgi:predicted TIM-barrel fold metal-dependent hydrolase
MRTIALEEHFLTQSFLRATHNASTPIPPQIAALQPKLLDLGAGRIAAMDESAIDLQVLSLAASGLDALPASTAIPLTRDINDELAAAIRQNPTRLAGFAILPLKDPAASAAELERCVTKLGFCGAMVDGTTSTSGAPALNAQPSDPASLFLDDSRFLPIWEAAAHLNVPIYLHPAPPPAAVQHAYYSNLPGPSGDQLGHILSIAGWGWHIETGLHTLRLILSGLFDRLPSLQLIIGHMGEGLPYALARTSPILSNAATHLRQPVAGYFQTNIHITTSGYFTQPPFRCALEVIGLERLMFSIDYPFSPNTRGRTFLNEVDLRPEDLASLTHRNAEQLLKLSPA